MRTISGKQFGESMSERRKKKKRGQFGVVCVKWGMGGRASNPGPPCKKMSQGSAEVSVLSACVCGHGQGGGEGRRILHRPGVKRDRAETALRINEVTGRGNRRLLRPGSWSGGFSCVEGGVLCLLWCCPRQRSLTAETWRTNTVMRSPSGFEWSNGTYVQSERKHSGDVVERRGEERGERKMTCFLPRSGGP